MLRAVGSLSRFGFHAAFAFSLGAFLLGLAIEPAAVAQPAQPAQPGDAPPDAKKDPPPDGQPSGDKPADQPDKPSDAAPDQPADQPKKPDDKKPKEGGAKGDASRDAKKVDPDAEHPLRDSLRLSVGPLSFAPIMLLQVQALPYVGDDSFSLSGDPADRAGFRMQRARFGLELGLADQGRGRISVELGSREDGTTRVHDAWLAYVGFPYAQVFAGAQTVPFSRSSLAGAGSTSLAEEPLSVRSIAPGNQVGIVGRGSIKKGAFTYDVGLFNGFSRSDQFFAGYTQNFSPFGSRFEGIAASGRIATEPLGPLGPTINDEVHQTPRFGLGADYFYSDGGARGIHGFSVDGLLHAKGFHLLGEFLLSYVVPKTDPTEPTATVANTLSYGAVADTGYEIIARLFGASARFEWIDANTSVQDEGDSWLLSGGLYVTFFDGMVKIEGEYDHREEVHGVSLANDAVLFLGQLSL